jgi:hypothetical protein
MFGSALNQERKMNESINSMFEVATRKKLRFDSTRGLLTVEQLWDVPLRSRDDFNLDTVAKAANKALKDVSEESFVSTRRSPQQGQLELALDIVKYVIETKLSEEDAAKNRADAAKEKEKLLNILAQKEDEELAGLSKKQIENRIRALNT